MTNEERQKYNKWLWEIDAGTYGLDIRMPIYDCLLQVATDCGYDQSYEVRFPDLNGDGLVDGVDASIILTAASHIAGGEPSGLTPEQERLADVNRDGFIDGLDASIVLLFNAKCVEGIYQNTPADWDTFINEIIGA